MGESVLYEGSRTLKPAAPCLVRYSNINKSFPNYRLMIELYSFLGPLVGFRGNTVDGPTFLMMTHAMA